MSLLSTYRNALPGGARLLWYRIERVLGQGAFGITYLATDDNLHRAVAIKEYLPGHLARREADDTVQPLTAELAPEYSAGLQRFLSEARTLARFEHPNIVRVHNVFEHLGTACMIMQYEEGTGLDVQLRQRRRLDEAALLGWLPGLLDGLETIHAQGIIHRDIKPANVLIRPNGEPVLLDFGSARYASTDEARTLTNFVSPGYAAIEQYAGKSDSQGPWTDIYGLGATLYRAMAGHAPPDAVERSHALAQQEADTYQAGTADDLHAYSAAFVAAVDHALQFRAQDRPQTVAAWRVEFPALASTRPRQDTWSTTADDETSVPTLPSATVGMPAPESTGGRPRRVALFAAGALLAFVAGLAALRSIPFESPPAAPLVSAPPRFEPVPPVPPAVDPALAIAARIADLLERAALDVEAARLTLPAGNNAHEKYRAVLALDPGHPAARQGIETIARRYVELGRRDLARGHLRKADDHLAKAESLTAGPAGAAELRRDLAAARARRAQAAVADAASPPAASVSAPPPAPPPVPARRLFSWLGGETRTTRAPIEDRSLAIPDLPPPR
jgi:serine/threonine protein kinase